MIETIEIDFQSNRWHLQFTSNCDRSIDGCGGGGGEGGGGDGELLVRTVFITIANKLLTINPLIISINSFG